MEDAVVGAAPAMVLVQPRHPPNALGQPGAHARPATRRAQPRPTKHTMETTLKSLCAYIRKVVQHRTRMYVRISGLDKWQRCIVSLRMRSVFTNSTLMRVNHNEDVTDKILAEIARKTYSAIAPILPRVKGWTVEVCPACVPYNLNALRSSEVEVKMTPNKAWVHLWKDVWVCARVKNNQIIPTMSYVDGYRTCNDWKESHNMGGVYRDLDTLVQELHNRRGPIEK